MESVNEKTQGKIRINQNSLYREEVFTDMTIGSLHQMTPVKVNGEIDKQRKIMFIGQTQLITKQGPLPIRFPIDARNLQQAVDKFPEAMEDFVNRMIAEAKEIQRQEESRIILPGTSSPGGIKLP